MPREIRSANDVKGLTTSAAGESDFKDRLVKLIPSEIVTAYVTIQGLIAAMAQQTSKTATLSWIVISVLFVMTPFYLYQISNVKKTGQLIFTSLAFLVWVLAIGSPLKSILDLPSTSVGSIILILYTLMIPVFYKG